MIVRTLRVAVAMFGSVLIVAGCADTGPAAPASPSTAAAVRFFEGNPEEYAVLTRACLEEAGFSIGDDSASDGFAVDASVAQSEEFQDATVACSDQIGQIKTAGLSQAELQERYDARIEQFACLVDNGLLTGDPISFEVFVEQYDRSGQTTLWEPTENAGVLAGKGPTDVCPRTTSW